MRNVLITGGTGTLGRTLVKDLSNSGDRVIVLTRQTGKFSPDITICRGDLTDAESLAGTVAAADVIVHCASNPVDPKGVDLQGTINLLEAIDKTKTQHFVYISIAGVDKSVYPYYQAKHEAEKMIQASGVPSSVIRATQFHDLVLHRLIKPFDKRNGLPLSIPEGMRFQPIDVRDVSVKVCELMNREAVPNVITMGGPEILTLEELTRQYLAVAGRHERIQPVIIHTEFYDLFTSGINLCPESRVGKISWATFLHEREIN